MVLAIDINDTLRKTTEQFIEVFRNFIDPTCDIEVEDVDDFDFCKIFPFESVESYQRFRYTDFAFDLYARAVPADENIAGDLNLWLNNNLTDADEDLTILYVSPMEGDLAIPSTLSFMANTGTRVREYYFPKDSLTVWDRCDILITANPRMLSNVPEGKHAVKVVTPYNKDIECKHSFASLRAIIEDQDETVARLLSGEE